MTASATTSFLSNASKQLELLRDDHENFTRLASLLRELSGIHLVPTEKNLSLMASRLAPLLRRLNLDDYPDLIAGLERRDRALAAEFIQAMTTNTTEFFREAKHFSVLADEVKRRLPEKSRAGDHTLRLWCAACSSGQEVYSTIMTLFEQMPNLTSWDIKFLATDIDLEILERAAAGRYTENEIQGVPPLLRQKYFNRVQQGSQTFYVVTKQIRNLVTFAPFNLMQAQYPFKFPFDVVFCRNVMIYFERPAAEGVARRLFDCLGPGGTLFLGHSETGLLKGQDIEGVATAAYRRKTK